MFCAPPVQNRVHTPPGLGDHWSGSVPCSGVCSATAELLPKMCKGKSATVPGLWVQGLRTQLGRWQRGRFEAPGGIFNPYVPPEECAWLLAVVPSRAAGRDGAGSGDRLRGGVFLLNAFQAYLKYLCLVF